MSANKQLELHFSASAAWCHKKMATAYIASCRGPAWFKNKDSYLLFGAYAMQGLRSFCAMLQQKFHNLLVALLQRYLKWRLTLVVTQVYVDAEVQ